jgi:hypothetical protein
MAWMGPGHPPFVLSQKRKAAWGSPWWPLHVLRTDCANDEIGVIMQSSIDCCLCANVFCLMLTQ